MKNVFKNNLYEPFLHHTPCNPLSRSTCGKNWAIKPILILQAMPSALFPMEQQLKSRLFTEPMR